MGATSCCKKDDDINKLTMFYNTKEIEFNYYDHKTKSENRNTSNKLNCKFDNHIEKENLIKEPIHNLEHKLLVLIQRNVCGHLYRVKYKKKLKSQLIQNSQNIIKKFETILESIYENRLSQFNGKEFTIKNIHNDEKIYFKVFKSCLAEYKFDKIFCFYKGELNMETEKHGYGINYLKNNSYYQGYWIRNNFSSFGRYIDETGCLYEGNFMNGILNGEGVKLTQDGFIYKGNFVDGYLEGLGVEDNDEFSYTGNFVKEAKNGKGKYFFKILNETYEGESLNNDITGYGLYIWNNKYCYEGSFVKGKMHGKGLYKWPDGGTYLGEYINNIKEGKGIFKWANGKIYDGSFKNGKPNGSGVITFLNGTKSEVFFEEHKMIIKSAINNLEEAIKN